MELPVPPGRPSASSHCHYKDHEFHLDDGCLVMFTDGLVERRGTHLDERLALLESSLRASPDDEPDRVADFVIDAMTAGGRRRRHRRPDGAPAQREDRACLSRARRSVSARVTARHGPPHSVV